MNDYNFGYLNGILNAFAHINNGNYRGHSFELNFLSKNKSLDDSLKDICDGFDFKIIKKDDHWNYLKEVLLEQLFYYQHNHNPIVDSSKKYSLFEKSFQEDFVLDFLNSLCFSADIQNIYKLDLKNPKRFSISSLDILIEMEDKTKLILHFSSYD